MGFRICYMAAQLAPQDLAEALGLELDGVVDEMSDGWWVARLVDGG